MFVCVCVGVNEVKPEVLSDCQAVELSPYGRPLINHAIWLLEYRSAHHPFLSFLYLGVKIPLILTLLHPGKNTFSLNFNVFFNSELLPVLRPVDFTPQPNH